MKYRKERLDRGIKARTEDIFCLSSWREVSYLVVPRALIVLLLIFPLLKEVIGPYWIRVFVLACIISLLSLSWDLLASIGFISLGQALFIGCGSYASAVLNKYVGWSPFFSVPVATLVGALLCTILLLPVLRLRGIYFVLVTLMYPLLILRIIEGAGILGGTEGISGLTYWPNLWFEFYIPAVTVIIVLFGLRRLFGSDYGMILRGIRSNDRVVMMSGINTFWYKTQMVFLAAIIGCFSGAFLAHVLGYTGLTAFGLDFSVLPLTCGIVGGVGTFAGSVIGSFIMIPLSETLRAFASLRIVFYCIILAIFVVALPEGVFHYLRRKYHQFERLVPVEAEE